MLRLVRPKNRIPPHHVHLRPHFPVCKTKRNAFDRFVRLNATFVRLNATFVRLNAIPQQKAGHREFLWVEGELLINWKPWKWWQKQQLTFWRRQLTLRVKSLFVENFEFKILVWDSEGGIPRNLSSVKSQSGITGRFAPFYSVWNLTAARTRCTICFRA